MSTSPSSSSVHVEQSSIDLNIPNTPDTAPSVLDMERKQLLLSFETKYSEATQHRQEDNVFIIPKDNLAVVEVHEENPKAAVSTPVSDSTVSSPLTHHHHKIQSDKEEPNLTLYVKESLQYFSQPKVRVVRKYKDYVKETIDDSKFSRRKYEVDIEHKAKQKKKEGKCT
jgi:hypothetical protein